MAARVTTGRYVRTLYSFYVGGQVPLGTCQGLTDHLQGIGPLFFVLFVILERQSGSAGGASGASAVFVFKRYYLRRITSGRLCVFLT